MTEEEYYAAARALGLRPSANVPHTWLDREGNAANVPDASRQTPAQRVATMRRLQTIIRGSSDL